MKKFSKLNVKLKDYSYPIFIGENLISEIIGLIPKFEDYSKIIVVTDKVVLKNLFQSYKKIERLSKKKFFSVTLPSGEKTKSFQYLHFLCEKILKEKIDRDALLICLGGGVIGDITGLTANLLLRGVDFIQIPTTLLAQVDSSVGGKTAINSRYGKNLIGSFNQPKAVIISTETLKKLEKRQVISGYAEILKYSLISDKSFFGFLQKNGKKILSLDTATIIKTIKVSCKIKSKIVGKDEKEKGIREILNFGHTFGHAIESFTGFSKKIFHGEAVILGMYLALKLSNYLGLCDTNLINKFCIHLNELKIPYKLRDYKIKISPLNFLKHIKFDKKIKNNKMKFILLQDFAKPIAYVVKDENILNNFLKKNLF